MRERQKIGIIGSGVSGLTAAYLLHERHDIVLFEANDYLGGHTNTRMVKHAGGSWPVDTGFIVFNEVTYPNFCEILRRLGVESQPAPMTFSVKCARTGFEYNPHSLRTLFARRRNLFSPSFCRMIREIFRLRNEFEGLLAREGEEAELVSALRRRGYSKGFITYFIVPLASSLWSTDPVKTEGFPLKTFVRFFQNHGFLHVRQPIEWRTIRKGSRQYVDRLTAPFSDRIRLRCAATEVRRRRDGVDVSLSDGTMASFDHVVIATHGDQALALLADPTPEESDVLGAIPYQENETVLHTDTRLLPSRKVLWASWNYSIPSLPAPKATITYDMNILQSIPAPVEFCVSLNQTETIDPARVIQRYIYHHPLYTPAAPPAQRRHAEISGKNRTHYCGAYWGYGFHEDGVNSALAACRFFGCAL